MDRPEPTFIVSPTTVGIMRVPGHPIAEPVQIKGTWTSLDPFAVTLLLTDREGATVTWYCSRELLATLGGHGDIRFARADDDHIVITLESPTDFARIRVDDDWRVQFVDSTEAVMPIGTEPSIVDDDEAWAFELLLLATPRD